jgi:hypothetical protein
LHEGGTLHGLVGVGVEDRLQVRVVDDRGDLRRPVDGCQRLRVDLAGREGGDGRQLHDVPGVQVVEGRVVRGAFGQFGVAVDPDDGQVGEPLGGGMGELIEASSGFGHGELLCRLTGMCCYRRIT